MTRRSVAGHQQTVAKMLVHLGDLPAEQVAVRAAAGRVPAADVPAPLDLPVFRNSQMDGYAVAARSVASTPVTLPLAGTIAAGERGGTLPGGAAIKIMTGAPVPAGADCIVPVEDTTSDGGSVTIGRGRSVGEFIREPGTDVRAGAPLVRGGVRLEPRHVAVLAAVGIDHISVRRRVRAAVITTGTELVPAGRPLGPGQIYDSNGIALAACLEANGVEVASVAHSSDDRAAFARILRYAVESADVVLTSGGVSMGDFEVVKETLEPRGGEFVHVAMQPGGPQGTAVIDGVPVLNFPGNPVSTLVSFEVFARPVLRRLAGLPPVVAEFRRAADAITSPAGRRQFLRGRRTDDGVALVSGPGSHLLAAMAWADVLVDIPADVTEVPAGADVQVWDL